MTHSVDEPALDRALEAQAGIAGDYQYRALRQGPRLQRFWHRNKLRVLREVLPVTAADTVLDLGCGSGNLTFEAAGAARLAVGLDASEPSIRFCNSLRAGRRCAFALCYTSAVPLAAGSVDSALLVEVIEHLGQPETALAEIRRVLKPGGRALVTTPNYGFPSLWPLLEWIADRSGLVAKMAGEQHVQQFRPDTLAALLRRSGFEIERLGTFYHLSPFIAALAEGWADRWVTRELAQAGRAGALIFCLARKPGDTLQG